MARRGIVIAYVAILCSALAEAGSGELEDILLLKDGSIVRGTLVESVRGSYIRFHTTQHGLKVFGLSEVEKVTRLPKGIPDDELISNYFDEDVSRLADDARPVAVVGGVAIPYGRFARSSTSGGGAMESGVSVGLDVGLRLVPKWRWLTTGMYSELRRGALEVVDGFEEARGVPSARMIWLLTGMELRTEGNTAWKWRAIVQTGALVSTFPGFDYTVHGTPTTLIRSGRIESSSSTEFAVCIGGGVSVSRFSLTVRLLSASARYDGMRPVGVILLGAGVGLP
ncbi:MAG: hypothetical protein AB1428_04185 [Bacteroidota bacterium]